jgi:hypothetical protein
MFPGDILDRKHKRGRWFGFSKLAMADLNIEEKN